MERKGYEGVIATITTECERLQVALASAEEGLEAARAKVAKWKNRWVSGAGSVVCVSTIVELVRLVVTPPPVFCLSRH